MEVCRTHWEFVGVTGSLVAGTVVCTGSNEKTLPNNAYKSLCDPLDPLVNPKPCGLANSTKTLTLWGLGT